MLQHTARIRMRADVQFIPCNTYYNTRRNTHLKNTATHTKSRQWRFFYFGWILLQMTLYYFKWFKLGPQFEFRPLLGKRDLKHTATHCNTLQRTGTHCMNKDIGDFSVLDWFTWNNLAIFRLGLCCECLCQFHKQLLQCVLHVSTISILGQFTWNNLTLLDIT